MKREKFDILVLSRTNYAERLGPVDDLFCINERGQPFNPKSVRSMLAG
jgi:hypothetical protein